MSATANAIWKVRPSRSERAVASGMYPSSAAAARTLSTIAGLAPEPCSARDAEESDTPARSATCGSVARDAGMVASQGLRVKRWSWNRFHQTCRQVLGNDSGDGPDARTASLRCQPPMGAPMDVDAG